MRIDRAAFPFVLVAAAPALLLTLLGRHQAGLTALLVPVATALFFRDPERRIPQDRALVLAPADGRVTHAGPARTGEAPPGNWQQVTIFLSLFDVHINRTPVGGRVTRVEYRAGSFLPAYRPEAARNEQSEIWIDQNGVMVVVRQLVGVLARRVVCRVNPGDRLDPGMRIGLMKFGSRMDVFLPLDARLAVRSGDRTRAGETVIARLRDGDRS